jgi:hypothetical protein
MNKNYDISMNIILVILIQKGKYVDLCIKQILENILDESNIFLFWKKDPNIFNSSVRTILIFSNSK